MLTLRPATMDDAANLFAWRNDPLTRAMSLIQEPVSWERHEVWLRETIRRPDRTLSIGILGGIPVGSTRVDFDDEPEVSITVAPEHRMKALPVKLLGMALPNAPTIIARIRRENTCSQRLVRLLGFQLAEDGPVQLWRHHSGLTSKKVLAA